MEFRKVLTLRGPNIWANFPVLEAWVDLGELKDSPSDSLPGFNDRLMNWLPTMIEHRCSIGERGGFFERLRRGTYPAHILEHVTLELQTLAGTEVSFGRARETGEEGVYKVAIEYQDELLAKECLQVGRTLLLAAVYDQPFNIQAEVARLRAFAQEVCLGPSTRSIVDAAVKRGIPWRRLNRGSLVQFGHGHKQRRILAAETDRTGAVAQEIAQDKHLTRQLLRAVGVPVAEGRPVASVEDALEAAKEIGFPVVVKPQDGNQGRGVATNLRTLEQVAVAFESARREGERVLVERFAPGHDHRLLVVGGKMIAAARRTPAHVIGDGVASIAQLVEQKNEDPRRGDDHATPLSKIRLDPVALAVLAEQGYAPEAIPPLNAIVLIRRNANLSTGGTAVDVTDEVHPQVAAIAIEAARVVGLDIAGIDVVAADISLPLEQQGGIIVEVNAAPGLRMHLQPSGGSPRPVGESIMELLYSPDEDGRVPIVAVTGVNGKTTTTRLIANVVRATGKCVGMTCTEGVYINDRAIDKGDCSGPQSARHVLMNPSVEAAVLETARGGILREGLGFDRCNVAVVTNIGEGDHLGLSDIESVEKLAKVKRTIVDVVAPNGWAILNAADPLVVEMAPKCPGKVAFFSCDAEHPVILQHRQNGGRAIFVRENTIFLADGASELAFLPLAEVPLTHGGKVGFQVENVLAATAATWCLGVTIDTVRQRVAVFTPDMEKVPGRFNVLELNGATIIVDYGHNASSLQAVIGSLDAFPHRRRLALYSTAGDRRDCDMVRQGELLAQAFETIIVYEDHYLRGRQEGEIIRLIRQGIESRGLPRFIHEVRGATKAMEMALAMVQPGDLLLLQADVIEETMQFMKQYQSDLENQRTLELLERLRSVTTPLIRGVDSADLLVSADQGTSTMSALYPK